MTRRVPDFVPQIRAAWRASCAVLLVASAAALTACGDAGEDLPPTEPRFVVDESPGTGTTGGNPTPTPASLVSVEIERPLNDGVFVRWERPELSFDTVEFVQLNPLTNTCDVRSAVQPAASRVRLGAGARLLFGGEELCRVSLRRDAGPVLRFQGTRPGGSEVEIAFADGAALEIQLSQWRRVQQTGGRLSLDVGVLAVEAIAIARDNSNAQDLRLTDADPLVAQRLRQALGRALVGYVDSNQDGELSLQERAESGVFLRFAVTP